MDSLVDDLGVTPLRWRETPGDAGVVVPRPAGRSVESEVAPAGASSDSRHEHERGGGEREQGERGR
jgi:hypothetical protein